MSWHDDFEDERGLPRLRNAIAQTQQPGGDPRPIELHGFNAEFLPASLGPRFSEDRLSDLLAEAFGVGEQPMPVTATTRRRIPWVEGYRRFRLEVGRRLRDESGRNVADYLRGIQVLDIRGGTLEAIFLGQTYGSNVLVGLDREAKRRGVQEFLKRTIEKSREAAGLAAAREMRVLAFRPNATGGLSFVDPGDWRYAKAPVVRLKGVRRTELLQKCRFLFTDDLSGELLDAGRRIEGAKVRLPRGRQSIERYDEEIIEKTWPKIASPDRLSLRSAARAIFRESRENFDGMREDDSHIRRLAGRRLLREKVEAEKMRD